MKSIFIIITAILLGINSFSQSPEKMSYQAVVRDSDNKLVTNQSIGMQISILQNSASGTSVYVETQTTTTNDNGLLSIIIGDGTIVSGTFDNIDWSNDTYYLKTEIDIAGGNNYSITGTSQLLSVPYALCSKTTCDTTRWLKNDNNIYFKKGNVGIKCESPVFPFQVNGNMYLYKRGQKLIFGSGNGLRDSTFAIYRPIGTDGIKMEANDIYIRSRITPIQLQSGKTINMMDLSGDTKMIVDPQTGNVGIGTTSPARTLHVNSVMRLEPIATAPDNPSKGDIYFDSTYNKLRVYDGTSWQSCW